MLERQIQNYLEWMRTKEYAQGTIVKCSRVLNRLLDFVVLNQTSWEHTFSCDTLKAFQDHIKAEYAGFVVRGFILYLHRQGVISLPPDALPKTRGRSKLKRDKLPPIYEQYIHYYQKTRQAGHIQVLRIMATLSALDDYLQKNEIRLEDLNVFHMDTFLVERNINYAPETRIHERSNLRGFLRYLYQERAVIRQDLSVLIQGPPVFAQSNPPRFLTLEQTKKLLESIDLNHPKGLRSYTMTHLMLSLGLRPGEVCKISLDDIGFQKKEISIPDRKNVIPARMPLACATIKALAAYIAWERPKDPGHRFVFCTTRPPFKPITSMAISLDINACFRKAGIEGSAYWLRHTYAQNLLQARASIFEIKEMLGHDIIKTSKKYLHIHTGLMREVLFNEKV